MPTRHLFISYARKDDTDNFDGRGKSLLRCLYDDLSIATDDQEDRVEVWWDQTDMPNRGQPFTQEIRAAIEQSDKLLLIVGEHALQSKFVEAEWRHALRACVPVIPLLLGGKFDIESTPGKGTTIVARIPLPPAS